MSWGWGVRVFGRFEHDHPSMVIEVQSWYADPIEWEGTEDEAQALAQRLMEDADRSPDVSYLARPRNLEETGV